MARISLRDYNREIEELVDSGRTDEAIAHCRVILETYPKHITTYRSLGKALLESQRYGDAADVFKRVLACFPDDFISHLGMSIIREDEGDLEGSIWHMERAFEVQPSNAAVQSELRRLYGRRDGLTPAKVQLTRGAMARMSAKSNLYSQAIAELRTALADDPDRPDLQALLARMYAQAGQPRTAIETCNTLLAKFPYCLEANRLMAEILSHTERAAEAKTFRQRLEELDPYESHLSPAAETADQVPAGAITLERLDYLDIQGPIEAFPAQHQWASTLGVSIEQATPAEESVPDWLSTGGESLESAEQAAAQEELAGGEIPDWMREAGWEKASGEPEESLPGFSAFEEEASAEELANADIPDWLQSLAPIEELTPETPPVVGAAAVGAALVEVADLAEETEASAAESTLETGPILAEAETAADAVTPDLPAAMEAPAAEVETAGLIAAAGGIAAVAAALTGEDEVSPAEELEPETPVVQHVETPPAGVAEWLAKSAADAQLEPFAEEAQPESIPEWLAELSPEESIEGIAVEDLSAAPELTKQESSGLAQAEIPQWLREMESSVSGEITEQTPPLVEQPSSVSSEDWASMTEEIPDWLKAAMGAEAAEQVIESATLETDFASQPLIEGDTKPVRVSPPEVEIPVEEAVVVPAGETAQVFEETVVEEISMEEAAQPELEEGIAEGLAELAATTALLDESAPSEFASEDEAMAWLESLAARQGASEEELLTQPEERPAETPEWLQQFADEAAEETEIEGAEAPLEAAPEQADLARVLAAGLIARKVLGEAEEEAIEEPVSEVPQPAEWLPEAALVESEQAAEEPLEATAETLEQPVPEELELPDWLRGLESETPESASESIAEEWTPPVELAAVATIAEQVGEIPRLDINTASLAQIERIPGVGFIIAQTIVAYREVNGPFTSIDQLQEIPGIPPETYDDLKRQLYVEAVGEVAPPPSKIPELAQAWQDIVNGDTPAAVEHYSLLIREKQGLDDVITQVQEALQVHPRDPLLHQTLGDAYLRADRLAEAMDAYNRAEDLIK